MWKNLQHKKWYGAIAILGLGVFVVALGGGLFHQQSLWLHQWQHKLFNGLCHQNPQRSFSLNGTPMAVCTRCLGIYSSFGIGWLLFPITAKIMDRFKQAIKPILVIAILINLIDITGNILGFWQNTLTSRYILGTLPGISAVLILGNEFINTQHFKTG